MNERHSCGAMAYLDWKYDGTEKDHSDQHEH